MLTPDEQIEKYLSQRKKKKMDQHKVTQIKQTLKKGPVWVIWLLGILVIVVLFFSPWVVIGAGERGVIMNFGAVQETVLNEGLHFRIPVVQEIVSIDVKVQKLVTRAAAASSDLQEVSSEVALNYHVIPDRANIVYQQIGTEFKDRIIDPAIQEVVKAVTALYTAEELITKRPQVSEAMREALSLRLLNHNIAVDAFSIVGFSFSQTFVEAIEAKQTAEQHALKAKRDLERVKIEAEQKVAAASAEAEALRLQRANISSDLIELRRVEATIRAIEKWNGVLPNVTGGSVPFISVGESDNKQQR
ncbi:Prohibitin [Chitinispirillum alkaliphilum]|nr:Prohibitin [Chitinispirillum alkaliphilum]